MDLAKTELTKRTRIVNALCAEAMGNLKEADKLVYAQKKIDEYEASNSTNNWLKSQVANFEAVESIKNVVL